jgi:carboxyl-terminal processing protease
MKSRFLAIAHFCIFLLISISGCTQNVNYINVKNILNNTDYVSDFQKVSDNVNDNYTHLKTKNIDGKLLQSQYLDLVKNAKSNIEYGEILIRYFAELRNSHSNAIFNKYYIDCSAALIENRLFIAYVGDKLFVDNGVKEKDEIVKINDKPVQDFLKEREKYVSGSTEWHRKYLNVSSVFSSYFEENRTYSIQTKDGLKEISVHFSDKPIEVKQQTKSPVTSKAESKILNDKVAYIDISGMTSSVVEDFVKAYNSVEKYPNLIVDLRKNTGGNSGNSEKIVEYFISQKQTACVSRRSLKPQENAYKGKLYVLTSVFTCSAAESFAIDLLESGNTTFVGMPTAGDTGNQPKFYNSKLGYSYWFPSRKTPQISPKGFAMEGESIKPHHVVARTISDYLAGNDTILNFTLNLIEIAK